MNGNLWRQARTVVCPTCDAEVGAYCKTRTGRFAESPHTARIAAGAPKLTEEELVERARLDAVYSARRAISVRTTFVLSCGCVLPQSRPIPMAEWPVTEPGAFVSPCLDDRHEYAVIIEVRTRMVADHDTLRRLFEAAGFDRDAAFDLATANEDQP